MIMVLGVKVPQTVGREIKGLLKRKKVYEDTYLPHKEENYIVFPLRSKSTQLEKELKRLTTSYSFVNCDLRKNNRTRSFRRELEKVLPKSVFDRASRAYEQVGDIGIISIFPQMEPFEKQIATALLNTNKGIRLVVKKISNYNGKTRVQSYEKLAGAGQLQTTHFENGVYIAVDIQKVYFSARTANERTRISSLIKKDENVLVLFSGCAPFPLVISKNTAAKKITGVELNAAGHELGLKNIKLNKCKNISLICGDATIVLPAFKEKFDRIIMPHPTEADYYLDTALAVLEDGGTVHMYLFSRPEKLSYVKDKIKKTAEAKGFSVKLIRVIEQLHVSSEVKKYCFDIFLQKKNL